jgi:dihydropteroate synthase
MEHALSALTPAMQLYARPTGFVDGPYDMPGAAVQLAGGLCWFSKVQVIGCLAGKRAASVLVDAAQMPELVQRFPALVDIWQALTGRRAPLQLGAHGLRLDHPHLMGVLNITPDSFSDGGQSLMAAPALARAGQMAKAGAALIDVGAESTRPGATPVSVAEELARLEPVLTPLCALGTPVSLDTRKADVMRYGLQHGVAMINDVSALTYDAQSLAVIKAAPCPVVLMHMQGEPSTMLSNASYEDVLINVYDFLAARVAACVAAGIARERIVVDPGIGFGKHLRHNLDLVNGLSLLHGLGCPILLGVSRKRMIGALSKEEEVDDRLAGSLALAQAGLAQGVQMLRVHDVAAHAQMLKVWRGLRDGALTPPAWFS